MNEGAVMDRTMEKPRINSADAGLALVITPIETHAFETQLEFQPVIDGIM